MYDSYNKVRFAVYVTYVFIVHYSYYYRYLLLVTSTYFQTYLPYVSRYLLQRLQTMLQSKYIVLQSKLLAGRD